MKLQYTTRDGRMTVEVEGEQTDVFKQLATFQEIFEDTVCTDGKETSNKVNFVVRKDDEDNEYYELVCVDKSKPKLNYAKKRFGMTKKDKSLFPKNGGAWVKWSKDDNAELDIVTGKAVESKKAAAKD